MHSAELPYQFPHFSNTKKLDGPDLGSGAQKLADQMIEYWTSFAANGVPQAHNARAWSAFKTGSRVMRFEPGNVDYFDATAAHHCSFWQKLYPTLLSR